MGSFFQVDLDVLKQFVSALRQSDDHLQTAMRAMEDAGESNQVGTDALNAAAEDFHKSWSYGVKQIGSMVKQTGDGVDKAHGAYQQLEGEAKQALGKLTAGL